MTSFLRTAHGNGADALLRVETPPLDEIPNANRTAQGLAVRAARGRPFEPGNAAAKGRKPKLARAGVDAPQADPEWSRYETQGRRYTQRRCRELAVQHGGTLGAGPSAMLASAGLALAASRWLYARAAVDGDADLFKKAASLADSARQQELTAVALAEREAAARAEDDGAALAEQQAAFQRALVASRD
jgi:hypothetical protein